MIEAIKTALRASAEAITPKQLEDLDIQIAEIFGFQTGATTTNRTGKSRRFHGSAMEKAFSSFQSIDMILQPCLKKQRISGVATPLQLGT
jgi:hypothetical protein